MRLEAHLRAELAPGHREGFFFHWPADVEKQGQCPVLRHTSPLASCRMAVQAGSRRSPPPNRRLVGIQQRESGRKGLEAKDERNGSWEEAEGKKKKGDVKAI
jgi:hypothetical protein